MIEEETIQQVNRTSYFKEISKYRELQLFLPNIAKLLEEVITETNQLENATSTAFDAKRKPSVSLLEYLDRISKYSYCSNECYIIAIIFMDRISEFQPQIIISSRNVHRFLITSIMIAIKYHDDEFFKNEYYARIGGISKYEINFLEKEFLELINYKLFIDSETYQLYSEKLKKYLET